MAIWEMSCQLTSAVPALNAGSGQMLCSPPCCQLFEGCRFEVSTDLGIGRRGLCRCRENGSLGRPGGRVRACPAAAPRHSMVSKPTNMGPVTR